MLTAIGQQVRYPADERSAPEGENEVPFPHSPTDPGAASKVAQEEGEEHMDPRLKKGQEYATSEPSSSSSSSDVRI